MMTVRPDTPHSVAWSLQETAGGKVQQNIFSQFGHQTFSVWWSSDQYKHHISNMPRIQSFGQPSF